MVARRSIRKRAAEAIVVINAMTGETIGRIGNFSSDGMMLISNHPIPEEHLYQVQFQLRDAMHTVRKLELGIQCLWSEAARTEHSHWAGCKIIDISDAEQQLLNEWLERATEIVQ